MTDFTLTVFDTTGTQDYIFNSNRLQENIGASELVYRATTQWLFTELETAPLRHNVAKLESHDWQLESVQIEAPEPLVDVEVITAGGGSTLLIFRDHKKAIEVTERLTRYILEEAPGLTVVAAHRPFTWGERLSDVRRELLLDLARHKLARLPSAPLLGLGVTAVCESTGLVAVGDNREQRVPNEPLRLISAEVRQKLCYRDEARERLLDTVSRDIMDGFRFPSQIDHLGRVEGEESYVAIIHADGNRMGEHIDDLAKAIAWDTPTNEAGETPNRQYVNQLRDFSQAIREAGSRALRYIVQPLVKQSELDKRTGRYWLANEIPLEQDYLPFGPLVFGGDDVTFLANGRLGLTLAAGYLDAFEREIRNSKAKLPVVYACAGIAIVKMHYPFARAYTLSEQLTDSAKRFVRGLEADCSALDWHFAMSGLSGALNSIRKREYTLPNMKDSFIMRPLRLRAESDVERQDGRFWQGGLEQVIGEFNKEYWQKKRNKVIGLREPLRAGGEATEQYRENFEIAPLPELIPGNQDHRLRGWVGERCTHFDAIELLDHYLPLDLGGKTP